jgi:hypothetical protein
VKRWLARFAPPNAIPEAAVATVIVLACALVAAQCSGCGGASPVRINATAANAAFVLMETAGDSIEAATAEALVQCHGGAACIDGVEARAVAAAGARDALIPLVHGYRAAVVAYGETPTPEALDVVIAAALAVAREWDVMREALAALGVTVPPMPFPVPGGDQ